MTTGYKAQWFDGATARAREATFLVSGGLLRVVSADRATDYPVNGVVASRPVAGVPPRLWLPDGGTLVLGQGPRPSGLPTDRSLAHRLESNLAVVFLALVALAVLAFFAVSDGLPWLAAQTARRIPVATEAALGKATIETLDRLVFRPTALSPQKRDDVKTAFAAMVRAGGVEQPIDLQFRTGRFTGPNALALPGGIIVVTDELVKLLESTELINAVLAHEVGHVIERHALQALLRRSASALVFGVLLGDVSGIGAVAAAAPAVFINLTYSREAEASADAYAFALLKRAGSSPDAFATALSKMVEWNCGRRRTEIDADRHPPCGEDDDESASRSYLSTHPNTAARIAAARAAARN